MSARYEIPGLKEFPDLRNAFFGELHALNLQKRADCSGDCGGKTGALIQKYQKLLEQRKTRR